VFWGLCFWDEKLIMLPAEFPRWLNHVMHSVPVAAVLLESILIPHSHQRAALTFWTLVFGIFVYVAWIVWINQISDVWPYPVLSVLGTVGRAIFIGAAALVILMFYFLGEALNKWRWGSAIAAADKQKKSK